MVNACCLFGFLCYDIFLFVPDDEAIMIMDTFKTQVGKARVKVIRGNRRWDEI